MKKGLSLLVAIGKPKSRNPNGVTDASETAPDQSGDTMMPGGEEEESSEPEDEEEENGENLLSIPQGFQSGVPDGQYFTTTVRACVMDTAKGKMLKVDKVGDVPLSPSQDQGEEEEPSDMSSMRSSIMKKRSDEDAANKAFKPSQR